MRPARHRRVRLYQLLRTAHLERAHESAPASILYTDQRYDFDERLAQDLDLVRAGTVKAAITLLRSRVEACEVNEPLVRFRLVRTLLGVAAVRVSGRVARRPTSIVTYAIENLDPFVSDPAVGFRSRVRRRLDRRMARLLTGQVDRIAFGTPAARALYTDLLGPFLAGSQEVLIPALPAPCACMNDDNPDEAGIIFVGAFEERKGVPELLAAWAVVSRERPDIKLTIVGKGRLERQVQEFAAAVPSVNVLIDPPRAEIHSILSTARGLVLLSQPQPRWREQVGLPIVEGLSHGCVVVATTESGLASWLAEHGHCVLDPATDPATVARCIIDAHDSGPDRHEVLGALPATDGRLAADAWLFAPAGEGNADGPPISRTPVTALPVAAGNLRRSHESNLASRTTDPIQNRTTTTDS